MMVRSANALVWYAAENVKESRVGVCVRAVCRAGIWMNDDADFGVIAAGWSVSRAGNGWTDPDTAKKIKVSGFIPCYTRTMQDSKCGREYEAEAAVEPDTKETGYVCVL